MPGATAVQTLPVARDLGRAGSTVKDASGSGWRSIHRR
jgi:hypothetical protein